MFNNLLESQARVSRNAAGQALSVVMHTGAIVIAVFATQEVVTGAVPPPPERIAFVAPPPPPLPPPPVAPRHVMSPAPVPLGHQVLIAPIDIPNVLPAIDLTRPITNPDDYQPRGVPGGRRDGDPGVGARPAMGEATYFAAQVEKPAAQIAGTGIPEYPEMLRAAGIEGDVRVQFVVDTTGRAELSTLTFMRSAHPQFSEAVRKALAKMRFKPAETGAKKLRQVVEMPFVFAIR